MLNRFRDFIASEREQFSNEANNTFAFCFSEIYRYFEFITIVFDRHKTYSKVFIDNFRTLQKTYKTGSHPMTESQMKLHSEGRIITTNLQLEVESFYLFAKILLDKAARAIEFYFGQTRKLPLDSHDDLTKNLESYSNARSLTILDELPHSARKLKSDVSDYRDYYIAHEKSPRITRGTGFDGAGNIKIIHSKLYPKDNDKQIQTKHLNDLMTDITNYLNLVIQFIEINKSKTALKLNTKGIDINQK